ncbi:hypothetical protein FA95DRAFT_1610317 [Auriscalpium vulgare]|uniref:Uncharacterized protein n=1 Tax=Auriscalpium vulgare TaxID=40419 RepID=A0ACB8RDY6_9AGAM|nr:hypothetical protein FA95DRAFT_1610317 [Auriscalpium vulgare]
MSASTAGAPSLPIELWMFIWKMVEYELSTDDLLLLRRVNRMFCALATPSAFRSVVAINTWKSSCGLQELLRSPLARYIEEVTIRDALVDCNGDLRSPSTADEQSRWHVLTHWSEIKSTPSYGFFVRENLVAAVAQLHKLPALRAVRLTRNSPPPDYKSLTPEQRRREIEEPAKLYNKLLETLSTHRPPHLLSLTLNNLVPLHPMENSPSFVNWDVDRQFCELIAGVKDLHLGIHDGAYYTSDWRPEEYASFWYKLSHTVLRHMQALTVLEVRVPKRLSSPIPALFLPEGTKKLPLLQDVLLEGIYFDSWGDIVGKLILPHWGILLKLQTALGPANPVVFVRGDRS